MFPFDPQPPKRLSGPQPFRSSRPSRTPKQNFLMGSSQPSSPPGPNHFMQAPRRPERAQNRINPGFKSMFQTPEGKLDFEKITGTVQQISNIYGQVSPFLTKFIK